MDTVFLNGTELRGVTVPTPHTTLLMICAQNGFLGCGYLNLATAEKVGDAVAIVAGVKSYDDMLNATVRGVSSAASALYEDRRKTSLAGAAIRAGGRCGAGTHFHIRCHCHVRRHSGDLFSCRHIIIDKRHNLFTGIPRMKIDIVVRL